MESAAYSLLEDYHLLSYDVLDSTNAEARRVAGGGAQHGALIWTKKQTDGRGRMGRKWSSPEGNLYVSVLLSPPCDMEQAAQLAFVTANAAIDTLSPFVEKEEWLTCKWPNDILLKGKKVGGVLLESFSTVKDNGEQKFWVVVGLGINIDSCPRDVRYPATCLRDVGGQELISAKIVLSRYTHHFISHYDRWIANGFSDAANYWHQCAAFMDEPLAVQVADKHVEGTFRGINHQGFMLLDVKGEMLTISAGDVLMPEMAN